MEPVALDRPDSTPAAPNQLPSAEPGRRLDQAKIARRLVTPSDPRLKALTRRRPARAIADIARCWALIAAAFALYAAQPGWPTALLAFVVVGTQQYALSILAHDGKHRNLFVSKRANDLVSIACLSAPLGVDFRGDRARHLEHHWRLGEDDDPDRDLYSADGKARRGAFLLFLSGLNSLPFFRSSIVGGRARPLRARLASLFVSRWPSIPAQALLFGALSLAFGWWSYFAFWIAPLYVLLFGPTRFRQFCEHGQPRLPDEAADPERLVTFRAGLVERILFAPMRMGYHAEHHLFPSVPYYRLPDLA
ncbi:MAG: fatty acid desaturase family protein, partial [Myxococcota bacterium]